MIKISLDEVEPLACGPGLEFAKERFAKEVQYSVREMREKGLDDSLIAWTVIAAARKREDVRLALCDWAEACGGVVNRENSTVDEIEAQIKLAMKSEAKKMILSGQDSKLARKSVRERLYKRLFRAFDVEKRK